MINIKLTCNQTIELRIKVFANGLEDRSSIPGRVMPKTQKMVKIRGKVKQFREKSNALSYISVEKLLKKEPLGHP